MVLLLPCFFFFKVFMLCLSEKNTDVFCKDTYLYYINQIFSDFSYERESFFIITTEKTGEKRDQKRKTRVDLGIKTKERRLWKEV